MHLLIFVQVLVVYVCFILHRFAGGYWFPMVEGFPGTVSLGIQVYSLFGVRDFSKLPIHID